MKTESAFQDKDEINARVDMANTNEWPSRYKFLNSYNGWRPGFAHLVIGNTHAGKSTFVRSIILDACLRPDAKILLYLSEESASDFKTELAFLGKEIEEFKKVVIYSEQDNEQDQDLLQVLEVLVYQTEPNLVILDNLTTCAQYNTGNPSIQAGISQKLKRFFYNRGIPWIVLVHTAKGTSGNRRLIEPDDVRGNQTIANEAQFCAGIQKIEDKDGVITSVIRILKHRGQNVHDKIFTLTYNSKLRLYTGDYKCRAEAVLEWLKKS
jgi:KaiC/GvpD/RAD55 family RecA-like ATPase